jgi:uncharacterized protein
MSRVISHNSFPAGISGGHAAFALTIPAARLAGILAAVAVAVLAAGSAKAQDFDCASAKLVAERTICSSPRLVRLDNRLAAVYGKLWGRLDNDNREGLRDHQLEFLRKRNLCNRDERCIARAYERQIGIIRARLGR